MNSGEHSLSLGGLYGAGRPAGVSKMVPALSRTNMSAGCMRSFGTPARALLAVERRSIPRQRTGMAPEAGGGGVGVEEDR